MTAVYEFEGRVYINLTNRCSNSCDFCVRNIKSGVSEDNLWLVREPSAQEVIEQLKRHDYRAGVVFCGYGEPTQRLEQLIEVAGFVKQSGGYVRLNTNGQADLIHKKPCAKLLKGVVDEVSISLNQSSAQKYQAVCHSSFGERAYDALLEFAKDCVEQGITTVLSVVDVIDEQDIQKCRTIASQIGASFRVREMIKE